MRTLRWALIQRDWCPYKNGKFRPRQTCTEGSAQSVLLSVTPRTVARQAPLSLGFSRHEHWSGWPFPPSGELPDPGIEPVSLVSPALASGLFTTVLLAKLVHSREAGGKPAIRSSVRTPGLQGREVTRLCCVSHAAWGAVREALGRRTVCIPWGGFGVSVTKLHCPQRRGVTAAPGRVPLEPQPHRPTVDSRCCRGVAWRF